MIVGIGVDIVEIARVDKLQKKFDERFAAAMTSTSSSRLAFWAGGGTLNITVLGRRLPIE